MNKLMQKTRRLYIIGTTTMLLVAALSFAAHGALGRAGAQTDNMIQNPSLEQLGGDLPSGWGQDNWGDNSAKFSLVSGDAADGMVSARVQIDDYASGNAKWYFASLSVQSGATYAFSDYYKSDVTTYIMAAFQNVDGAYTYTKIGSLAPSSVWSSASVMVMVPDGTTAMTVYHLLDTVGVLQTDNYALTLSIAPRTVSSPAAQYQPASSVATSPSAELVAQPAAAPMSDAAVTANSTQGFTRPLISLNFDDGYENYYNYGVPILEKYGFVSTDFIISSTVGQKPYMSLSQVRDLHARGHEIGSHTLTHTNLTTLSSALLNDELQDSQTALTAITGAAVPSFAAPFGSLNSSVSTMALRYYTSVRGVEDGYNTKTGFDNSNLRVQNIYNTTTLAEVQQWVSRAQSDGSWLILVLHSVNPSGASDAYNVTPAQLGALLAIVKNSGVPVVTQSQALAEVLPQVPAR